MDQYNNQYQNNPQNYYQNQQKMNNINYQNNPQQINTNNQNYFQQNNFNQQLPEKNENPYLMRGSIFHNLHYKNKGEDEYISSNGIFDYEQNNKNNNNNNINVEYNSLDIYYKDKNNLSQNNRNQEYNQNYQQNNYAPNTQINNYYQAQNEFNNNNNNNQNNFIPNAQINNYNNQQQDNNFNNRQGNMSYERQNPIQNNNINYTNNQQNNGNEFYQLNSQYNQNNMNQNFTNNIQNNQNNNFGNVEQNINQNKDNNSNNQINNQQFNNDSSQQNIFNKSDINNESRNIEFESNFSLSNINIVDNTKILRNKDRSSIDKKNSAEIDKKDKVGNNEDSKDRILVPSFREIIPQNINNNNFNDNIGQEYKESVSIENISELNENNTIISSDKKSIIKVPGLSQIVLNDFNSKNNNEDILKNNNDNKINPSFHEDKKISNINNNMNSNQIENSQKESIIFVPTLSQVFRKDNNLNNNNVNNNINPDNNLVLSIGDINNENNNGKLKSNNMNRLINNKKVLRNNNNKKKESENEELIYNLLNSNMSDDINNNYNEAVEKSGSFNLLQDSNMSQPSEDTLPIIIHGHPLIKCSLSGDICSICSLKKGSEEGYKCNQCSLIICDNCIKIIISHFYSPYQHQHKLMLLKKDNWKCNKCQKLFGFNNVCFWCEECKFGMCVKCYVS